MIESSAHTAASRPATKALGLKMTYEALRQECVSGDELNRIRAALSAPVLEFFDSPSPAFEWVPAEFFGSLAIATFEQGFARDDERMRAFARAAILRVMRGPYRIFIKVLSPEFVARRMGLIWSMTYRDNGVMRIAEYDHAQRFALVEYRDVRIASEAFWCFQQGTGIGVLELTRLKGCRATLLSGGGTSGEAMFRAEWD